MVPAFFVLLEKIPLTSNNKVDRLALPAPTIGGHAAGTKYVAPRNSMETQLAALWQQVLGVQEIGIHDNFFDLGGHSLKAAQLFFQLEVVFGKQLPLATLFQAPTIAELAAILLRANWSPPWQSLVAIQPSGSATPLFLVPGVGGNVLVFAKLARLLGIEQPVYGLQARGLDGKEAPFTSVPDMAAHYIQQIRHIQPQGPYLIAGICTGGLIAYEMAQQLAEQSATATVLMMDTWHPDSYARYRNRLFGQVFMTAVVLGKIGSDLSAIIGLPMREWWPTVTRKTKVLFSLFWQPFSEHIQDQDLQIQRLTQATFLAVARYHVKRFTGQIINFVASRRQIDDVIPDTRHRWPHLGNKDSRTVHIPAEDSGRLFVSPHVEELAAHLQKYLRRDQAASSNPSTSGTQQA
jgi:acyl carrier protein